MAKPSLLLRLVLLFLLGSLPNSYASTALILGMNYNWLGLNQERADLCSAGDRGAEARGRAFLAHYADPAVQGEALAGLKELRSAGFSAVRVLVFFGQKGHVSSDVFDVSDPRVASNALGSFAHDVHSVGFSRLYVSFGPLGELSPACKHQTWGDCFKRSAIPKSVAFVTGARSGISASDAGILYVDLQNEGGIGPYNTASLHANMEAYLTSLIRNYAKDFPGDRTTVSIQDRNPKERLQFVLNAYNAAGFAPRFLDIHAYHTDPKEISEIKSSLSALDASGLPVTIGETLYDSPGGVHSLENLFQKESSLPIIFWPLKNLESACGIDTAPPYSLEWLRSN